MRTEEKINEYGKSVYFYDDNERHVRTASYNEKGELASEIRYYYNNQNKCEGWMLLDSKGDIISRFEADFDENGRETETRQFNKYNELELRTVNNYDKNGVFVSESEFDGRGIELNFKNS